VLGASLVAAIVCSLALAWGVGEVAGYQRTLERRPFAARWYYGAYVICVIGSAVVVWVAPDLVWLNIAAQALNAFLMPLAIGILVTLAATALPVAYRLGGWRLGLTAGVCAAVAALGMFAGLAALL
jgi:hypothetical protein